MENRIEDISVKIPSGISTGKKLRLPGKGLGRLSTVVQMVIYI